MSYQNGIDERAGMELALDILEDAVARLDMRSYVPISVLTDVVEFIDALEDVAFEAQLTRAGCPELSRHLDQQGLTRVSLEGMRRALQALDEGEAAAAIRFVRFARDYVTLRRAHLRADRRLFHRPAAIGRGEPDARVETSSEVASARVYERLLAAAAALDIGGSASPAYWSRRPVRTA